MAYLRIGLLLLSILAQSACFEREAVPFKQLHIGFNAPPSAEINSYYTSAAMVQSSWIASALTGEELTSVLSEVDFNHQALVAMYALERKNATTSIYVSKVWKTNNSVEPVVFVGTIDDDCRQARRLSRPFVLLSIDWPKDPKISLGYFFQNFSDDCKPTATVDTKVLPKPDEAHKN